MRKLKAMAALAVVGLGAQTTAFGYGATANLTFSWATGGTDKGWTSSGANSLASMSNSQYFTSLAGSNSTGYYNSDFATVGFNGACVSMRKYGCRDASSSFIASPITNAGPGAQASGTLTVTDTTLTGTLTIVSTTDQPTGGTTTSAGNGTNGYNIRAADGSPFGNSWNGITTLGTYTVNLTGTFTATSWDINGGWAKFSDAGFLCQQGAVGTTLCNPSTTPGGFQTNGGALTWGWELDGAGTGLSNTVSEIQVRDQSNNILASLSGVLASLSVDGLGNVTTNSGEIRRGLGASAGCGGPNTSQQNVTYNTSTQSMTCGTVSTALLNVTGTVVPVPAAVWLFGSALGLLGVARRRMIA